MLGYGEKQDDDLLHNYTVAKAVMDCTFELDSPYYQCHELVNGVRVAFIACTCHWIGGIKIFVIRSGKSEQTKEIFL